MSCLKRSKTPNSPHEFEITRNFLIATGVVVLNNDYPETHQKVYANVPLQNLQQTNYRFQLAEPPIAFT
jgi:hypothetical protein